MEQKACRKALDNLRGVGIIMKEAIHNDNKCMENILDDMKILNQKHLWHKAKNMVEKLFLCWYHLYYYHGH